MVGKGYSDINKGAAAVTPGGETASECSYFSSSVIVICGALSVKAAR